MSGTKDAIAGTGSEPVRCVPGQHPNARGFRRFASGRGRMRCVTCWSRRFDATAGADSCARNRNLKQFVSCILEGQFIGQVIENSGAPALGAGRTMGRQWRRSWTPGQQNPHARRSRRPACHRARLPGRNVPTPKCCATSTVEPAAIEYCPNQEQRDACIYWASFARSIIIKLDRIGS